MSYPSSSTLVANEWLNVCGLTRFVMPVSRAASLLHNGLVQMISGAGIAGQAARPDSAAISLHLPLLSRLGRPRHCSPVHRNQRGVMFPTLLVRPTLRPLRGFFIRTAVSANPAPVD